MANIGEPLRRVKIIPLRVPVRSPEPAVSPPPLRETPVPERADG